jgi:hypothetical protein
MSALRGGYFFTTAGAGVFALRLDLERSFSNLTVGFRSAFVNL